MTSSKFTREQFAQAYNDQETYPSLADVANALGVSYQTVRNHATLLRKAANENGPVLISRRLVPTAKGVVEAEAPPELSPYDHATARAQDLRAEIDGLLTRGSRYPVINPDAVIIDAYQKRRYDRRSGNYELVEGTPRTWLTDTLRVAPVADPRGRRYLFTGAQNDAPIHEGFWQNLKAYALAIGAEIVVGPWTYETQWWSENNPTSRAYDTALSEYLCFGQMALGDGFVFCGEMNTLPTANRPISDLVTYSRGRWAVFPHAKRELHSVPSTDPTVTAHQVMTTGAVTRPKVIPRKAGVKSIFHHVIGATLVEFDNEGDFFCRQISGDDAGAFFDLDAHVADGLVTRGHRVRSIVFGDIHRAKLGATRAATAFGIEPESGVKLVDPLVGGDDLLSVLKPEFAFLHDVFDNQARNHHHTNDNAYSYERAVQGTESVADEVRQVAWFLLSIRRPDTRVMVVASNHDIALDRYVLEGRYRNDGINIRFGMELELAHLNWREEMVEALDAGEPVPSFNMLEHACRAALNPPGMLDHVTFLNDGASFKVDGVECGHHGFRGANGAKGTIEGFARMGPQMTIGDKHSPGIRDGVYVAGVSELQMGYNKGPSGWAIADVVQYADGKRALITSKRGKWRAAT